MAIASAIESVVTCISPDVNLVFQEFLVRALNPVTDSLKSHSKKHQLARTVSDHNTLLLLLRKANIEIQLVAESSLALAHYVSGYVTKTEESSVQEIWQEVK